ncbi:MAG TPA: diguanylate cyclase [Trueperaceae bacterium]|nr:diguanylate cyclase [Trueperaceae bacterium]
MSDAPLPSETLLDKILDLLVDTVCVVDGDGRFLFVSAAAEGLLGYLPDELLGRNMLELVHPDDRELTLEVAREIMGGRAQTHFENRWLRKDGRPVDIMWSARWSEPDGVRLAVARDVTPLRHAARLQDAVYRISEAAQAADDLPDLLHHVQGIIGDLVPADTVLAALYDEVSGNVTYPYAAGGRQVAEREPQRLRPGSPLARVLATGEPLLTATADGREAAEPAESPAESRAAGNWLGAPLIGREGVLGALVVEAAAAGGHAGRYSAEHLELLKFVSTQVATVIERKRDEARLKHLALHDPLTDLPNRTLFHDRIGVALDRALRDGERVGLLFIDVDDFKRINDDHGHETGDALLRALAERLEGTVRRSDTVARMGGDEFTVLLTDLKTAADAELVARKIRSELSAPYEIAGGRLTISVSIGSAVFPDDGRDQDALIRHADTGMYARKAGRG